MIDYLSAAPITSETAKLALSEHALHLAKFATGEEPPPIVEQEAEARLIFAGVQHLRGVLNAQRELIEEFQSWAEEMRRRVSVLESLMTHCPALEQWRTSVLHDRRQAPLVRIAAWEITSVKCDAAGDHEHAIAARETARSLASASSGRRASTPPTAASAAPSTATPTAASTGTSWQHQ